jgi:hypothetical protein
VYLTRWASSAHPALPKQKQALSLTKALFGGLFYAPSKKHFLTYAAQTSNVLANKQEKKRGPPNTNNYRMDKKSKPIP